MSRPLTREEEGVVFASRYALVQRLGDGASGRVYEAFDRLLGRHVALKLLRPFATQERKRVEREITALRLLRIPSVAGLVDHGVEDDQIFLVLELVPGRAFPGLPTPVAWADLAPLAERLLETLGRVHAAGIVHRDVKPANVLVTPDGNLGLLDFGLAWGPALGSAITVDFVGTVSYAAPEQFSHRRVDARADLYAVGVMLYEALAGRLPWSDDEVLRLVQERANTEPPPLRSFRPDLGATALNLVDALMRRDPAERPRTASEALDLLRAAVPGALTSHRMPWLGPTTLVDRALAILDEGRGVDIGGPPGSGRTRVLWELAGRLEAAGRKVGWLGPGQGTFESIGRVVALDLGGDDPFDALEGAVRGSLGPGGVLLADDLHRLDHGTRRLLDRIRGRFPVVRVVQAGGDLRCGPLGLESLRGLFTGPDRVLHLREDGAAEMLARTSGLAQNVATEASTWVTGGLAAWEGARLRVARDALDRLASGLRTAFLPRPADEPGRRLEAQLRTLLAWAVLAGEHASVPLLAEVSGEPRWAVAVEIEQLVDLGYVAVDDAGRIRVLADPGTVTEWSEERTQIAHAALARALAPGVEGRLAHLLSALDYGGAREECEREARHLADRGAHGRAFALLQIALGLARQLGEDPTTVLEAMASVATDLDSPRHVGTVLYELRRVPATPRLRQVRAVLEAVEASYGGDHGLARAIASRAGPVGMPLLELARTTVLVRAGMVLEPGGAGELLAALEPALASEPLAYARWLGWVGNSFRAAGRFREAVDWFMRAATLDGARRHRHHHLHNAALAQVDALDLDAGRRLAEDGIRAAREAHAPVLELRGELLLRDIAWRRGEGGGPDEEMVQAASLLEAPNDFVVFFQEALFAWRAGDHALAVRLADRCRIAGEARGIARASAAGELLIHVLGGDKDIGPEALLARIRGLPEPRLQLQFLALHGLAAAAPLARIRELHARLPPADRGRPLEIFSADACLALAESGYQGRDFATITQIVKTAAPKLGKPSRPQATE